MCVLFRWASGASIQLPLDAANTKEAGGHQTEKQTIHWRGSQLSFGNLILSFSLSHTRTLIFTQKRGWSWWDMKTAAGSQSLPKHFVAKQHRGKSHRVRKPSLTFYRKVIALVFLMSKSQFIISRWFSSLLCTFLNVSKKQVPKCWRDAPMTSVAEGFD